MGSLVVPGLVLAHFWVELGSGVGGCGFGGSGTSASLLVGRLIFDTAGCGIQCIPKLVSGAGSRGR